MKKSFETERLTNVHFLRKLLIFPLVHNALSKYRGQALFWPPTRLIVNFLYRKSLLVTFT
jgi:hypothetical protein